MRQSADPTRGGTTQPRQLDDQEIDEVAGGIWATFCGRPDWAIFMTDVLGLPLPNGGFTCS